MWERKTALLIAFLIFASFCFVGVIYYTKERKKGLQTITLYGNVDVRQVDLGFRANGKVMAMPFEEGDYITKGTLLSWLDAEPYADEVLEAEANSLAIRLSLQNAEEIFQRREELIGSGGVSQEDYDNARTSRDVYFEHLKAANAALGVAKTNLENTKLYAPTDGTILTRIREPGTVVLESDPVYTLSIISPVWVRAYIPEPLFGVVKLGMGADIYTDTKGGKVYKGKLGFISPVAEFTPKTVETTELRTDLVYRVRIYADNPDWGLKQGMPVTVKLYHDQSGLVNLEGHHSSPSLNDPTPAVLRQYSSPHDRSNLDHSEALQNSQNLTDRGINGSQQ